jgi:hypothetical protein
MKRQEDLTRRIQDKLAKAKKRVIGRNIIEIKKKETASIISWPPRPQGTGVPPESIPAP